MSTQALLTSRESSHGDYPSKAEYIQKLKSLSRTQSGWSKLTPSQRESLDNIFQKIGRVLTGDSNFKDHWDDISGYAMLCSEELKGGNVTELHVKKENFPDFVPTTSVNRGGSVGDN